MGPILGHCLTALECARKTARVWVVKISAARGNTVQMKQRV